MLARAAGSLQATCDCCTHTHTHMQRHATCCGAPCRHRGLIGRVAGGIHTDARVSMHTHTHTPSHKLMCVSACTHINPTPCTCSTSAGSQRQPPQQDCRSRCCCSLQSRCPLAASSRSCRTCKNVTIYQCSKRASHVHSDREAARHARGCNAQAVAVGLAVGEAALGGNHLQLRVRQGSTHMHVHASCAA